jgi:hypothetical protein
VDGGESDFEYGSIYPGIVAIICPVPQRSEPPGDIMPICLDRGPRALSGSHLDYEAGNYTSMIGPQEEQEYGSSFDIRSRQTELSRDGRSAYIR